MKTIDYGHFEIGDKRLAFSDCLGGTEIGIITNLLILSMTEIGLETVISGARTGVTKHLELSVKQMPKTTKLNKLKIVLVTSIGIRFSKPRNNCLQFFQITVDLL